MANDFDLEAFKFVEKHIEKKVERSEKGFTKLKGLGKIIDLGKVSNLGIEEFDEAQILAYFDIQ